MRLTPTARGRHCSIGGGGWGVIQGNMVFDNQLPATSGLAS